MLHRTVVLRVAAMNKDGYREGRAEKPQLPRGQASPIDLGDILLHLLEGHVQLGEQLQVRILDLAVFLFEQKAQAPVLLVGTATEAAVIETLALGVPVYCRCAFPGGGSHGGNTVLCVGHGVQVACSEGGGAYEKQVPAHTEGTLPEPLHRGIQPQL